MTNIIASTDSNDDQSLTFVEKFKQAIEKERASSGISLELWNRNVQTSTDQSLLHFLRFEKALKQEDENKNLGGYWWHQTLNIETGTFNPKGSIKIMDADNINKRRRMAGKDETGKYLNYPLAGTAEPTLSAIDETTLGKVAEFYGVPYEEICDPKRNDAARLDLGLWPWVRDKCTKVMITEGFKKSASVLDCGIVCISLPGVTLGVETNEVRKTRKKKERVEDLESGITVNRKRGMVVSVRISKALDQVLGG